MPAPTPALVPIHRLEHAHSRLGPWTHIGRTNYLGQKERYYRHACSPLPNPDHMSTPYELGLPTSGDWHYAFTSAATLAEYFAGYLLPLHKDGFRYRTYLAPLGHHSAQVGSDGQQVAFVPHAARLVHDLPTRHVHTPPPLPTTGTAAETPFRIFV